MNDTVEVNRSGPWDVPLRNYVKECRIVVLIHNLEDDSIDKEFHLDYGNYDDRKFLGKLSFWAVTNGRSVETLSEEDYKAGK